PEGRPITISVDLAGETCTARIRKASVGRVDLYLLDANVAENPPHLRSLTARLYGGDLEMRLRQEILIGIGGVRALAALGLSPQVIHMNEGHSAFAGLERIRSFMHNHGLSFETAKELAASTSIFTTHTPVPAGNDRFPPELMERYFTNYSGELGLAFKVLLAHGRENPRDDEEQFCMTVLALNLSRFNNGVSQLHGHVSRNMWKEVWDQYPVNDVPIGAITNGVHTSSWIAPDLAQLYDRYLGSNWREDPDCARVWSQAESIAEAELWRTHSRLRARLVDYVRGKLQHQLQAKGADRKDIELAAQVLDPEALTIGFARRFATYKRAGLLLLDKERLIKLVTNKERPVQFLFAGKAHPQDNEGKKLIQDLVELCRREDCRLNLVFIEDYDIEVAQYMVQGCDVWLNTPRRPLEACGTSGMKGLVNGVLNLSTLDGWWVEAYKPDNSVGWCIGRGEEYTDHAYQDFIESQALYTVLENEIIPEFYNRTHGGQPRTWVRKMKNAIKELVPLYNSHRMVEDYSRTAYIPAMENHARLIADTFAPAKELADWRMDMMTKWGEVAIRNVRTSSSKSLFVGDVITVQAEVHLNGIAPDSVRVDIYGGRLDVDGNFRDKQTALLSPQDEPHEGWLLYKGDIEPADAGRFGFTVRAQPRHPLLVNAHALGLIRWAQNDE
ncbi:MAG: alpha-glucan family phosphorylase, partial [Desulfovibrio sp.]